MFPRNLGCWGDGLQGPLNATTDLMRFVDKQLPPLSALLQAFAGDAKTSTILLFSTLAFAGCSRVHDPIQAASKEPPHVRVAVARAERKDLSRGIELAAEFRPYQEVDLHAKVAGYLKTIHVDVGDRVQQGRVIGILEVPEFAQEMAQASALERRSELDVERAQAEIGRAQSGYDIQKLSYERLLAVSNARPKLIARQEIDTASARFREAEAQLAAAKSGGRVC